jgi:nicotinate phosphoribosyltransferase
MDDKPVKQYGVVSNTEINAGGVTDEYFCRTEAALDELDVNPFVVADVQADQFSDGENEMVVGVEWVAKLLTNTSATMWGLPDGALFDGEPVVRIAGNYRDFARYETALLGLLSEASGYATQAYRLTQAAGDVPVLSFGSRHNHPAMAAVLELSAWFGGVDGYSNIVGRFVIDEVDPSGTMPHALMLSVGDKEQAWTAFNDSAPADTDRIVLADTFTDEVDESLHAARTLGADLDAVRLDTTSSRRGDFTAIIREVRHELDSIGRDDVGIVVSGGIDVDDIEQLKEYVDGFGVGSAISDAPSVDFGLDIVKRGGKSVSKRGKLSGVDAIRRATKWVDNGSLK